MRVGEESVGSIGAAIRRHGTQTVLVLLTGKVLSDSNQEYRLIRTNFSSPLARPAYDFANGKRGVSSLHAYHMRWTVPSTPKGQCRPISTTTGHVAHVGLCDAGK